MLIRLIPPHPHPTILYGLTFPAVLSLNVDLNPSVAMPAAWSSQLQIITSLLQLEPPSSIHMLDRAVGLVARVHEVTMDVPQKEFELKFVDGRVVNVPMNSECARMLLGVVDDVKGCSEPESQRNSVEGSVCPGSVEDPPSGGSPTKSSKPAKHKRQRSLLFSLISLLVPKSLASSPPPSAPPPTPLPPLPVPGRVTSPVPPKYTIFVSEDPDILRSRARATLIDVWRRHVISALTPQDLPAAGYIEWTLIALASTVRAEIESIVASGSRALGVSGMRMASKHRRTRSDGRNAIDFGDRSNDCGSEQWLCRASSPFPGLCYTEDTDRVVYPRREQADEWGVRHRSIDEASIFAIEFDGHNDSLLGDHFAPEENWDDAERVTFELSRTGRRSVLGNENWMSDDKLLPPGDFVVDFDDGNNLAGAAFDMSRCPVVPFDVTDDEQSDDNLVSLRIPEEAEELPLASPAQSRPIQDAAHHSRFVSRVKSFRPRARNVSAQFSSTPSACAWASRPPTPSPPPASRVSQRNTQDDELLSSRIAYLDRVCTALELVRNRAREEGWRLFRATLIGAKNGWMDAEAERSLENKAKRRAWSSGIKISAPYSAFRSASKMWGSSPLAFRSPMQPPGLASSARTSRMRGPIVPTGLSLGIPERRSPLAMYAWSAEDSQQSTPSKYGILGHRMETIDGKRSSRVTFADNVGKLFPVCEDEGEDVFEPADANAVGSRQAVPPVAPEEPDHSLTDAPAASEDDPFQFCPSRPRTRTTSMYMISPTPSAPSSPVPPMFRPSTPPPSYQAAVGSDIPAPEDNSQGRLDPSALLLQPLTSLSISSPPQVPSQAGVARPLLIPSPPLIPRPRAVSMPTPRSYVNANKNRRTSAPYKEEHYEDLSQAYALPPPAGPLVMSATPAPHEQYPRYAHVYTPTPVKPKMSPLMLGRTGKEVVFEQGGSEFTVGIEVALGRAEEGRVVW